MSRWLAITGIGEDGVAGLGAHARALIRGAAHVFGGARHLELAAPLIIGEAHPWQSPISRSIQAIEALRGQPVCVLASGDPFLFGIGATLSRTIPAEAMTVVPAPSAFSLAAARLGWPLQDATALSLHGRPIELVLPHLHPGRRILALTSDEKGPAALAALLVRHGFGPSRLSVLEAMGGPRERIRQLTAEGFVDHGFDPLNLCAIETVAGPEARILPLAPGLPDAFFEHDGQLTKREIRALTLAALAPRAGERLWDIGAGAGSIAIEWLLAHPSLEAIAIEAEPERAGRIRGNALALGVPGLEVVEGRVPGALAGLPPPDAIFIGGGGSAPGLIEQAMAALPEGGRLVVNAVTTALEARLLDLHARHGGTLTRIAITRAAPLGGMTGWRSAMPVTQWGWERMRGK